MSPIRPVLSNGDAFIDVWNLGAPAHGHTTYTSRHALDKSRCIGVLENITPTQMGPPCLYYRRFLVVRALAFRELSYSTTIYWKLAA
jgi:hypothetical protein